MRAVLPLLTARALPFRVALALPLLVALASLAGCSHRERANPLDPGNPQTGGRPLGFNAVAGFDLVSLQWMPQPALGIDGFLLQRLAPGDSLYRPLGPVFVPGSSSYNDAGTTNGLTYRYRLYYLLQGAPGRLPAEDLATPGPLRPWVADHGAGELLRLSPDGRDVVARYADAGTPQSLAIDPLDGRVWTSSSDYGLVTARLPGELQPVRIEGLGEPFTLAVSPLDQGAWICDLRGSLRHYSATGAPLPGRVDLLSSPTGVAVSPRDFSVWVCEQGANRVQHLNSAGAQLAIAHVVLPSRVAVDSASGQAWITSFQGACVWRVSALGAVLDSSLAAAGPIGIAIDARRARAWIADPLTDRVLALDLASMDVVFTVTGLPQARDVDVDPASGEAWVVARSSGEIVRISPSGTILQRFGGFSDPIEVRLDPGQ